MGHTIIIEDEVERFLDLVRTHAGDKADRLVEILCEDMESSIATNMVLVHGDRAAFPAAVPRPADPAARTREILAEAMCSGTNMAELLDMAAQEAPRMGVRMLFLEEPALVLGPRHPRANTAFRGEFMAAEASVWEALDRDPALAFEDARDARGWCRVGDDPRRLVREGLDQMILDLDDECAF